MKKQIEQGILLLICFHKIIEKIRIIIMKDTKKSEDNRVLIEEVLQDKVKMKVFKDLVLKDNQVQLEEVTKEILELLKKL